jgi:hypothetical protein
MKSARIFSLAFLIFIFSFLTFSYADVPSMINYQGKITTSGGALVDTAVQMIFTIYDDSTSGNIMWADTISSVSVEKGIFSVLLGSNNSIPDSVFDGNIRYLGTKVGTDAEMTPRKAMVSVAYAYRAGTADGGGGGSCGWVDDGTVIRLETQTDSVGIGTTTPGYKLHLQDSSTPPNPLVFIDQTGTGRGLWVNTVGGACALVAEAGNHGLRVIDAGGDGIHVENASGWAGYFDGTGYFSGKVGIGTTSPTCELEVKKDHGSGTCIKINNAQAGEYAGEWVYFYEDWDLTSGVGHTNSAHTLGEMMEIATYRNIPMTFRTNDNERMRIAAGGEIGIGITSPGDKLDVNGDIRVRGADITDAGGTSRITLTDDGRLDLKEDNGSSAVSIATNSYVGMGTTTPDKHLTLKGATDTSDACIHLDAVWNPEIFFDAGASQADGKIHFQTAGTEKWTFYHDGSENSVKFNKSGTGTVLYLASSGNVGIGVTTPLDKLDVNGTARLRSMGSTSGTDVVVDGNGTLYRKSSSRRYKENIERLNSDPYSVFELTPVRFEWKTTGAEDIGLVAEDVVKTIPDLVIYDNEGKPDAVKYDRLTLYLLELAKAQQKKISELEKKISELEKSK